MFGKRKTRGKRKTSVKKSTRIKRKTNRTNSKMFNLKGLLNFLKTRKNKPNKRKKQSGG
jgi:uncharacterized Rmd1/YagE family protein